MLHLRTTKVPFTFCIIKMVSFRAVVTALFLFCMAGETWAQINAQTCASMIAKVNELKADIEGMCADTTATPPTTPPTMSPYSSYKWTSTLRTHIGSSNLQHAGTVSFTIPSVIPSSAREVLIHAGVYSGSSDNFPYQDIKIFTQIGTTKYKKYLFLYSTADEAINTNSDNMWFPMPPNRRVYLTAPTAHGIGVGARLFAIGYR